MPIVFYMKIKQYNVSSFIQFVNLIKTNKKDDGILLFRGQSEDFPLYSNLYRHAIKNNRVDEVFNIERDILKEVKEALSKTNFKAKSYNDWDFLTIAQHYGLPTRFLDWTENPYIALWFAFESDKSDSKSRVVWGLIVDDEAYVDVKNDNPFNQRFIKVFKPNLVDARVFVQESWFSVQDIQFFGNGGDGLPHLYANDSMDNCEEFEYMLAKFIIPTNLRSDILINLESKGINYSTMYPDLKTRFKKLWPRQFRAQ